MGEPLEERPVVYLIHFERPYHHARHYLGFTTSLEKRLDQHRFGKAGSHLMRVINEAGIGFACVRTWERDPWSGEDASRTLERRLKNQKMSPRLCPVCKGDEPYPHPTPAPDPPDTYDDIPF